VTTVSSEEWTRLIGGGFAYLTAPFAVHPKDRERAIVYLDSAIAHGLTVTDAVEHAREYLRSAQGWPVDIDKQLRLVEQFFTGKLPQD